MPNKKAPGGFTEKPTLIKDSKSHWISLERMLDEHSIAILVDVIDKHNIYTHDEFGRQIVATNNESDDIYSKKYIKAELAKRYSMLQDPGPDDSSFHEWLEISHNPLELFGWPKELFPNIDSTDSIQVMPSPTNISGKVKTTWIVQAQAIATIYLQRNAASDLHPTLQVTSEHVAQEMRAKKIYGPHLKPLDPETIKRHALTGDFWDKRKL